MPIPKPATVKRPVFVIRHKGAEPELFGDALSRDRVYAKLVDKLLLVCTKKRLDDFQGDADEAAKWLLENKEIDATPPLKTMQYVEFAADGDLERLDKAEAEVLRLEARVSDLESQLR